MRGLPGTDAELVAEFDHEGRTCRVVRFEDHYNGYVRLRQGEDGGFEERLDLPGGVTYGPDADGWIGFSCRYADCDCTAGDIREVLADASERLAATST